MLVGTDAGVYYRTKDGGTVTCDPIYTDTNATTGRSSSIARRARWSEPSSPGQALHDLAHHRPQLLGRCEVGPRFELCEDRDGGLDIAFGGRAIARWQHRVRLCAA
jgi:hypothetical protein